MAPTLRKIILLLMFFVGNKVAGQVRFVATLSPAQISKDETSQLRFTIENGNNIGDISTPPLSNVLILAGPSEESNTTMINGVTKSSYSVVYTIKPKQPGKFNIPTARAVVNGITYRTNPIVLTVKNTLAGNSANTNNNAFVSPFNMMDPFGEPAPEVSYNDYVLRKGESAEEKVKRNMLVRLEVNKLSCTVGEPVIATYKLYTRLKSESNVTQNPSFNGFSVLDLQLPNNMNYTNERYNGKDYNVYVIRKVQLYPLQSGELQLEPVEVENRVRFIKAEYADRNSARMNDIFNDFSDANIPNDGVEDRTIALRSEPVRITVKPLPEAKKPVNFKGAVGKFSLVAGLEKTNLSTDDAGKLQIVLNGEGNLQLITSVDVKWPKGIDPFDAKVTDDISKLTVPISGRKLIEYPFTITDAGDYTIAPVEFSFFDPKTNTYQTAKSEPITFTVTKGTGKPSQDTLAIINEQRNKGFLQRLFSNRRLVVSIVAVLILTGLIIWLKRDNKKIKEKRKQEEEKASLALAVVEEPIEEIISNQKNHLEEAEIYLSNNNSKQFYSTINQAFKDFLSQKLHIPVEELNKKTINEKMDKNGIAIDTSIQVQQLMDQIEWELYTPFAETEKMQQTYDKANELIQLLNTYKV